MLSRVLEVPLLLKVTPIYLKLSTLYGRLYAQLDQPQKVRFEGSAVEVYGLL